jgi:hypothetical protein
MYLSLEVRATLLLQSELMIGHWPRRHLWDPSVTGGGLAQPILRTDCVMVSCGRKSIRLIRPPHVPVEIVD